MSRPRTPNNAVCPNPDCEYHLLVEGKDIRKQGKNSAEHQRYQCMHFNIADRISKSTGERLGVIDATIWFYGADRPKEIKKPICGTEPLCDECYLTMFCKHYQNIQSNRNLSDFTDT